MGIRKNSKYSNSDHDSNNNKQKNSHAFIGFSTVFGKFYGFNFVNKLMREYGINSSACVRRIDSHEMVWCHFSVMCTESREIVVGLEKLGISHGNKKLKLKWIFGDLSQMKFNQQSVSWIR